MRYLKNKYVIAGLVIVILILAYFLTHRGTSTNIESATATVGNVVEKVSVTGTVSPVGKADLSFEKSGVIERIAVAIGDNVKAGDVIAVLDSGSDAAALASAQADLAELERGLRPEELSVDQANLDAASTTLVNAEKDAINGLRDSFDKAEGAVVNYADTFFTNPQSSNPTINIPVKSVDSQVAIDNERLAVSEALNLWKANNNMTTNDNVMQMISNAEGYLDTIKTFMSDLSNIVNDLNLTSNLSQTATSNYVSVMNTAISNLTVAITSVTTVDTGLRSAQSAYTQANNQFTLEMAGTSQDTINAQIAKVAQAQAELDKDEITSPLNGTVTRADPNVGEFATAGQSGFSVESSDGYKIDAFVPEADIAKVTLKATASVTLDAYGSDVIFPAYVSAVDPAETVVEGVPTYKVTLLFVKQDSRIRSGMTANTDILTNEVDNVLNVPTRAVIDDNGSTTVRVLNTDGTTFTSVPVIIGLKGSDGTTEITSGLSAGQKVVTYVK